MKCQIQWIDKQGNPTPDDNEAIGYAICRHTDPCIGGGYPVYAPHDSAPYPICHEHKRQLDSLFNWRFTPRVDA